MERTKFLSIAHDIKEGNASPKAGSAMGFVTTGDIQDPGPSIVPLPTFRPSSNANQAESAIEVLADWLLTLAQSELFKGFSKNHAPGPAATAPETHQVQLFQPSPTGKPSRKPRKPRAPARPQSAKPSPKKRRKK